MVLNLSADTADVDFHENLYRDEYIDLFEASCTAVVKTDTLSLPPWAYRVFVSANFPLI